MVDQTNPSPAENESLVFQVRYNLGFSETLDILSKIDQPTLTGKVYAQDIRDFNKDVEINARQPRPESTHFSSDLTAYNSDLANFLYSIYLELQTTPEFNRLTKVIESTLASKNKAEADYALTLSQLLKEFKGFEVEKNNTTTFSDEENNLRRIIQLLSFIISICIKTPDLLLESTQAGDQAAQSLDATSSATTTPGGLGLGGQQSQPTQSPAGGESPTTQIPSEIPAATPTSTREKINGEYQLLSTHAGFIYNHVIADISLIYGDLNLNPQEMPSEIQQAIRGQITANLFALENLHISPDERLKLEKKILYQILIGNPGLTHRIKLYLLDLPQVKSNQGLKTTIEKADDISDKAERIQLSRNLRSTGNFKSAIDPKFAPGEQKSLSKIAGVNNRKTITEIEAELLAGIKESSHKDLSPQIIAANIARLVDSKILTQQNPELFDQVQFPSSQLELLGFDVKNNSDEELAIRNAIKAYWYQKLAAYSKIVGAVNQSAGDASLALQTDTNDRDKFKRDEYGRIIFNQKGDEIKNPGAASFVAYYLPAHHLSTEDDSPLLRAVESQYYDQETDPETRRIRAVAFVQASMAQQEAYHLQLAEIQKQRFKNGQADIINQQIANIQYDAMKEPEGVLSPDQMRLGLTPSMIANQLDGARVAGAESAGNQLLKTGLAAAIQANPYGRVAMFAYQHRQKILIAIAAAIAALLLLLAFLLQSLALFIGTAIMILVPGGLLMGRIFLGKDAANKIGNWVISNIPTALGNIKAGISGIANGMAGLTKWGVGEFGKWLTGRSTPFHSGVTLAKAVWQGIGIPEIVVGGTTSIVVVTSIMHVVNMAPLLQPTIDTSTGQISKHLTLIKSVEPSTKLTEAQNLTYNVVLNTNKGYSIQIVEISDVLTIRYNEKLNNKNDERRIKSADDLKNPQTGDSLKSFLPLTINEGSKINLTQYTEEFNNSDHHDTSVTNSFEIKFKLIDPYGGVGTEIFSAKTGESVCFGECPAIQEGCWPTSGYLKQGPFCKPRASAYDCTHSKVAAIDISNNLGTHVFNTFEGTAYFYPRGYGYLCSGGEHCYGNHVVVKSSGFELMYAHLNDMYTKDESGNLIEITKQTTIKLQPGDLIGETGYSGLETWGSGFNTPNNTHLHWELRPSSLDMTNYVPGKEINLEFVRSCYE